MIIKNKAAERAGRPDCHLLPVGWERWGALSTQPIGFRTVRIWPCHKEKGEALAFSTNQSNGLIPTPLSDITTCQNWSVE